MLRSHTFRGKRWLIEWIHLPRHAGMCLTPPDAKRPTIQFRPKLKGLDRLDTIIHESLHACFADLDESVVGETATDIARLLWRLGYRAERDAE
jgi:hypothetical protein